MLARFWWAALVSSVLVISFFVALLIVAATPALLPHLVLTPAAVAEPWEWYRLLTFGVVQISLRNWLLVGSVVLVSGWIAERWLDRRTMWIIAAVAALSSGVIYVVLAPVGPPLVGGGFIAAGFAGAAVVSCILRRQSVSRGTQLVALALLVMYAITPLRPEPQSLAMFGAFISAGGYAAFRLRSLRGTQAAQAKPDYAHNK